MSHKPVLTALIALVMLLGGAFGRAVPAQASVAGLTFTVSTTFDAPDAAPGNQVCETANGNGICTLRAALMESNSLPGADTVVLPANPLPYGLTGALTIADDLTLTGAGAASTVIDGNGNATQDRVMFINQAVVHISGVTIRNGRATDANGTGGGIWSYLANLTLSNVTHRDNVAESNGGGLYAGGSATLINTTVTGNTASSGGGIGNTGNSWLTLINSTVSGNHTDGTLCNCSGSGGGLAIGANANLINSTISGNWTEAHGGGISTNGVVRMYNATVTNNTAGNDGGGLDVDAGDDVEVWVQNTLVAGNFRGNPPQSDDCSGPLASAGYNLLGNNQGCAGLTNGVNGDKVGTNANPLNARIGPLANNGGFTQTHALIPQVGVFPGSPAIDRGNPAGCTDHVAAVLTSDQRANLRQLDGDSDGTVRCDIGAFEFGTPFRVFVPILVK